MKAATLQHLLDDACERHPDKLAVACGERRLSFAQVDDLAARLGAALADAGLAGERVATLLPNRPELIVCYLACWKAGAIMVPFEYVDAAPEIHTGLVDCGARWLIVHEEKRHELGVINLAGTAVERVFFVDEGSGTTTASGTATKLHPSSAYDSTNRAIEERRFGILLETPPRGLPVVAPETLAFILYTSGSTALPKGVAHSHRSAAGIIASVLSALSRVGPDSRVVIHDSVSHMGGWIEAFPLLWRGASIVLERDFEPSSFYDGLRTWRPTLIGAHIDSLWQIVRYPDARRADFASVDTVFTGGDELPLPLQRAFLELTGMPIEIGWGMTEAIWLTISSRVELTRRGFMGVPVDRVELRTVGDRGVDVAPGESGELWVRGPMVSPGYWNRPEADREVFVDGWLRTGDMGLRDEAGEYWFTGRLKQIIERNSENITPGEIEQALYRHPAIAEAGAFGVPDPLEGQVPIAYVVFKSGQSASEAVLKTFLESQIAAFKIPARILPIDALPLTHSGKLDHKSLAELYAREVQPTARAGEPPSSGGSEITGK